LVPQNVKRYSRGVALIEVVVTESNCILLILIIKIDNNLNLIVEMILNKGKNDE
jgi:hypothetical protein